MVTSIEDLKQMSSGMEVTIPGFSAEDTITLKLKRPSLIDLVAKGSVPNELLNCAASLFKDGLQKSIDEGTAFKDMSKMLRVVAESALVEPSYDALKEAGIELTDVQLVYIYNFVQSGVDPLKSFRDEQTITESTEHSESEK